MWRCCCVNNRINWYRKMALATMRQSMLRRCRALSPLQHCHSLLEHPKHHPYPSPAPRNKKFFCVFSFSYSVSWVDAVYNIFSWPGHRFLDSRSSVRYMEQILDTQTPVLYLNLKLAINILFGDLLQCTWKLSSYTNLHFLSNLL